MKLQLLVSLFFVTTFAQSQSDLTYKIYNATGKPVSYAKMIRTIAKSDVLLFGEYHDNAVIHALQLKVTKDLARKKSLVLGAEMIEADNQSQLDQYLNGEITQSRFDTVARLWPNHKTDYKPLVDFAKENQIPFIATNVPRRFASMVYKGGFEKLNALSPEEKSWMAPLPIAYDANLPGYKKMMEEMGSHGGENLPKAQALKDATMANFIMHNCRTAALFIHYNGTYHSDNFDGIYWYLKQASPKLKIATIATVTNKNLTLVNENYNKAHFIIVTDEVTTETN